MVRLYRKGLRNTNPIKTNTSPGATISNIHHHIISILKMRTNHITLRVLINITTFRIPHEILNMTFQLENTILNTLKYSNNIFCETILETDNGKAVLTFRHLNEHLTN